MSRELPWTFTNIDPELKSPNGQLRIDYEDLGEIAMGGPSTGKAFLVKQNQRTLIDDRAAGSPVWNTNSKSFALPVWRTNFPNGHFQQLLIFDVESSSKRILDRSYSVLNLKTFENEIITGVDSPIHKPKIVKIDLNTPIIKRTFWDRLLNRHNEEPVILEQQYKPILTQLSELLGTHGHKGQQAVVDRLINYLTFESKDKFLKKLNSVDMWGGSGAVWEVFIDNQHDQRRFHKLLSQLLQEMKASNIKNKHAYALDKLFNANG